MEFQPFWYDTSMGEQILLVTNTKKLCQFEQRQILEEYLGYFFLTHPVLSTAIKLRMEVMNIMVA